MVSIVDLELLNVMHMTKSLKESANKLRLKEQSIRNRIESMERNIGLDLASFNSDSILFTKAGLSLAKDAEFIIRYINTSVSNARLIGIEEAMALRVGTAMIAPEKLLIEKLEEKKEELKPLNFMKCHIFSIEETLRSLESHIDILATYYDERLSAKYSLESIELRKSKVMLAFSGNKSLMEVPMLDIEDIYGKKLYIYRKGYLKAFDAVRADIKEYHKEIEIVSFDSYSPKLVEEVERENAFLVAFREMEESLAGLTLKPVLWKYSSLFGILYKKDPSDKVRKVLKAL